MMWPLMPRILSEQLGAETVHDRHHDDQRRDAEHDAEEGEDGDDRDEAFLAARAQIAQRQHPLERRERPRAPSSLAAVSAAGHPCAAGRADQPIQRRVERQRLALAGRAPLDLHLAALRRRAARRSAARAGRSGPSMANFAPARWSRVVVEHVHAGLRRARRRAAAAPRRSPRRRPSG